jgi:hypothetical protein
MKPRHQAGAVSEAGQVPGAVVSPESRSWEAPGVNVWKCVHPRALPTHFPQTVESVRGSFGPKYRGMGRPMRTQYHPCDHCKGSIHLKYKYCRYCARRLRQVPLRSKAEQKDILKARKRDRQQNRYKNLLQRITKLPQKNRKKSSVIDALLSGTPASVIIGKRR